MKKYLLLLLFIPSLTFGQLRLPYPSLLHVYHGDTIRQYFQGGSAKFTTSKDSFQFNKPIFVNGVELGSGGSVTDSTGLFKNINGSIIPFKLQNAGKFDNSTTDPIHTTRLNYDGKLYSNGYSSNVSSGNAISGIGPDGDISTGIYGMGSVGVKAESWYEIALLAVKQQMLTGQNDVNSVVSIQRGNTGTGTINAPVINIIDNPNITGTVSGSILKAQVGTTVRTDLNPRATRGNYLFDTNSSINDTASLVILGNAGKTRQLFKGNGDVEFKGMLKYKACHAKASADSINYTTGSVQNVFYKINTGSLVVKDTLGITIRGDSIKIQYPGTYNIWPSIAAATSNSNDKLRVKLFRNNTVMSPSLSRYMINSNGTGSQSSTLHQWYVSDLAANTWLSFRIQNQTGSRAITITDFSFYIEKVPE